MSTKNKKPKSQSSADLNRLGVEIETGIKLLFGKDQVRVVHMAALQRLLVEKKIVTIDELRKSFVDEVERQKPEIVQIARMIIEQEDEEAKPAKRGNKKQRAANTAAAEECSADQQRRPSGKDRSM